MTTISNVLPVDGGYQATVTVDGNSDTMSFATDPSQFTPDQLNAMTSQVNRIRLATQPEYIQKLAVEITDSAYAGMTDQQMCDALNAATITKYTPVPVDVMVTALVGLGVYPKLYDAMNDKSSADHAAAVSFMALMDSHSVSALDLSLPAAQYLFTSFTVETAPPEAIAAIKALGIAQINFPESIGYAGSITLSDISNARG